MYSLLQVQLLTDLPVLTDANRGEEPEWHAYVEALYGGVAALPLDLRTFTFFYWSAPLRLSNIYLCDWNDGYDEVPRATLFSILYIRYLRLEMILRT